MCLSKKPSPSPPLSPASFKCYPVRTSLKVWSVCMTLTFSPSPWPTLLLCINEFYINQLKIYYPRTSTVLLLVSQYRSRTLLLFSQNMVPRVLSSDLSGRAQSQMRVNRLPWSWRMVEQVFHDFDVTKVLCMVQSSESLVICDFAAGAWLQQLLRCLLVAHRSSQNEQEDSFSTLSSPIVAEDCWSASQLHVVKFVTANQQSGMVCRNSTCRFRARIILLGG